MLKSLSIIISTHLPISINSVVWEKRYKFFNDWALKMIESRVYGDWSYYCIKCDQMVSSLLCIPAINNNYHESSMHHSKSFHSTAPIPPPILTHSNTTKMLQQRLKKEISLKFNRNPRQDEVNRSSQPPQRKHNSLLLSNPLTKSSFSLTDAITHKATVRDALDPVRKAAKSLSSKKVIALSSRQRYSSFDEGFFKTGADVTAKEPPVGLPKRTSHSSLDLPKKYTSQDTPLQQRHNKFKLLLREKNTHYKSASERKIARIDNKITLLRQKRIYLQSLLPVEKPKVVPQKTQSKKYPVTEEEFRQKINKMVVQLIRTVELYFNMYVHNNIVGGHFRHVQGYNRRIRNILMIDDTRAKRIAHPQEVTAHFQVFKEAGRSETFVEEDMGLFSVISNFLMKLEKKYGEMIEGYNYYQNKRRKDEKEAFRKAKQKFEKKMGQHQPINRINHFIEHRLRFDQTRREEYMQNLQKRGVVLNLIERSRQLILREKQNAVKNAFSGQN